MLILILTSIPTLNPPSFGIRIEDKIYHFLVYLVFGLALARALIRNDHGRLQSGSIIAAILGSIFAVLDEWHQIYIDGRYCDLWDASADIFGVLIAILSFNLFFKKISFWEEKMMSKTFGKRLDHNSPR